MKAVKTSPIKAVLLIVVSLSIPGKLVANNENCTYCDSSLSKEECIRILVGNSVDIYYGKAKPCLEEQ